MKLLTCLLCGFLSWSVVAQVGADFDHDRIDWIYGVNPVFDSLKDHIPTSLLSLADSLTINETSYPRRESLLISDSIKSLELSSSSADFRIVLMYNEGDLDGEQRMYLHNHLAQRAIYQNGKLVNPYTLTSLNGLSAICHYDSKTGETQVIFYDRHYEGLSLDVYASTGLTLHRVGLSSIGFYQYEYQIDSLQRIVYLRKFYNSGNVEIEMKGNVRAMVSGHTLPISMLTNEKYLIAGCFRRYAEDGEMLEEICK